MDERPSTSAGAHEVAASTEESERSHSGGSTETMGARLSMLLSPAKRMALRDSDSDPSVKLRQAALTFHQMPAIFQHFGAKEVDIEKRLESAVPDWAHVKRGRHNFGIRRDLRDALSHMRSGEAVNRQAVQKASKVPKTKAHTSGRTYTSKFRGVHQTFPTKRWEAQFRRNGKPTSLGCFDEEEEAARAYDKMMIWCELNHSSGIKAGITNFDMSEYEKEISVLSKSARTTWFKPSEAMVAAKQHRDCFDKNGTVNCSCTCTAATWTP